MTDRKTPEEIIARSVFRKIAVDPDWDDAYLTAEQADACGDDDISQEEAMKIAQAVLADLAAAGYSIRHRSEDVMPVLKIEPGEALHFEDKGPRGGEG